jgi:hypothetical protein
MFSIKPRISILTVRQKLIDFLTSARAISWGAATMTASSLLAGGDP